MGTFVDRAREPGQLKLNCTSRQCPSIRPSSLDIGHAFLYRPASRPSLTNRSRRTLKVEERWAASEAASVAFIHRTAAPLPLVRELCRAYFVLYTGRSSSSRAIPVLRVAMPELWALRCWFVQFVLSLLIRRFSDQPVVNISAWRHPISLEAYRGIATASTPWTRSYHVGGCMGRKFFDGALGLGWKRPRTRATSRKTNFIFCLLDVDII